MRSGWRWLVVVLVAAGIGVFAVDTHHVAPPPARAPQQQSHTIVRRLERAAPPDRNIADRAPQLPSSIDDDTPLPASLDGTDIDGWLGVDDQGHFVVTPGARGFFDYFLSATGEEPLDRIRARIIAAIEQRLPPAGAREAIALLDSYLTYRTRARDLAEAGAPDDLEQRLSALRALRREVFGDANATALFGEEEATQQADLERRRVMADSTLTPEERQRKLDELDRQVPEAVRAARAEALAPQQLSRDEAELRAQGANAEKVRALREGRFGGDAADRLEALDREEAEWRHRLGDYRDQRTRIEGNRTLSPEARAAAIATLRSERFTAEERIRVEALDRISAANPGAEVSP